MAMHFVSNLDQKPSEHIKCIQICSESLRICTLNINWVIFATNLWKPWPKHQIWIKLCKTVFFIFVFCRPRARMSENEREHVCRGPYTQENTKSDMAGEEREWARMSENERESYLFHIFWKICISHVFFCAKSNKKVTQLMNFINCVTFLLDFNEPWAFYIKNSEVLI